MHTAGELPNSQTIEGACRDHAQDALPIREAIRRSALFLFSNHGFHAISIRRLAASVGLHPGSLYVHFETKQDVLAELIEEYEHNLTLSIQTNLNAPSGQKELELYVRTNLTFRIEHRESTVLAIHDYRFLAPEAQQQIDSTRIYRKRLLIQILQKILGTAQKSPDFLAAGIESVIQIAAHEFRCDISICIKKHTARTYRLALNMLGLPALVKQLD